ncbi:hypothetical protein [Peribacillus simplex]|nr:hypothetical protein [Peribacillus simplex]MDR4928198.1 hypothetical protein [Peribacillus simplex]
MVFVNGKTDSGNSGLEIEKGKKGEGLETKKVVEKIFFLYNL